MGASGWLTLLAFTSGCSHDWDTFDPRLTSGAGGASTSESAATTTGTTGTGTGTGATGTGGAGGAGTGGATTTTGTGGAAPLLVTYAAVIAACIDTTAPDPAQCAAENGGTRMTVDLEDTLAATPRHAYVRFDLDSALAGKVIDGVTLRLVVATASGADSDQTGEVWAVGPFDVASLGMVQPGQLGAAPLAADQGPVVQGQVVDFSLPTDAAAPNASTYLGVLPVSTDGVDYWNLAGATPPTLRVTYH